MAYWKTTLPDELLPCAKCDSVLHESECIPGARCENCGALIDADERGMEEAAIGEERRDALGESWIRGLQRRRGA